MSHAVNYADYVIALIPKGIDTAQLISIYELLDALQDCVTILGLPPEDDREGRIEACRQKALRVMQKAGVNQNPQRAATPEQHKTPETPNV